MRRFFTFLFARRFTFFFFRFQSPILLRIKNKRNIAEKKKNPAKLSQDAAIILDSDVKKKVEFYGFAFLGCATHVMSK